MKINYIERIKAYSFYIVLVLPLLTLNACKKAYLEPEVKTSVSEQDVWSSFQNASLFLNGIYLSIPTEHLLFGTDPFDNWTDNQLATFPWPLSRNGIAKRDYTPANSPGNSWWDNGYAQIRKCNIVIKNAGSLTDASQEQKDQMIAQAKFFRAYWYSTLANFFGGVPLIDVPLDRNSDQDIFYPRSTFEETVVFIQKDLAEATEMLPKEWGSNDNGRATKGAALALKSEVELYAGKWQDCVNTCNALFALGKYTLAPDYRKMFIADGESGPEVIFEVLFDGGTRGSFAELYLSPRTDPATGIASGWGHVTPTQELIDEYEFLDGASGNSPEHAADPYVNRDKRFYASVLYNGSPWRGGNVWTYYDPNINQYCSNFDVNASHQGTLTGYYFNKYLDPSMTPSESNWYANKSINNTNAILFRLGEIYLNFAEAKNELTGPDATVIAKLNELRTRGGVPLLSLGLSQNELREKIRHERRVELAFEGKRYWDIIRWKIAEKVVNTNLKAMKITKNTNGTWNYERVNAFNSERKFVAPRDYLFPIPQAAIDKNEKLKGHQNPGW